MSNQQEKNTKNNDSKKNSNIVVIIIVVVLVICALFAALTMWTCKKISLPWQKTVNTGSYQFGDVSVNVNQNVWPSDAPSIVPKFSAGKIEASGRLGDVWTITISGITDDNYNNYKDTLKNSGWTIDSTSEIDYGDMKTFTAKNNGYVVNVILSVDEQQNKNILISISKDLENNN